VCCLACVGLLEPNNEDKCNQCQRPVWKDNYYIIHSKNYCSEKCKKIAVKNYLKKNSNIKNVNIKHIQNEYFRNDSPTKNLQELRKEVKELYNDFEFDSTIKSNEISIDNKVKVKDNNLKEIQKINDGYEINDKNENCLKIVKNSNDSFSLKNSKKCSMIPIKKPRLKKDINIFKNHSFYKNPISLSKKREIANYKRNRTNYSFDNQDRYLYPNNNININPPLKLSSIRNNHSMSNINQCLKKRMKLKPTILRYQNKRQKLKTIMIPNPNMPNMNEPNNYRFKIIKYRDSLEKNENEDYSNIQYVTHNNYNNYNKIDSRFNTYYQDENRCPNFHAITKSNNQLNDDNKIVYLCDTKY
jgi:endogenous inhibitor of DNA gyrase (YacG/DUF329 family)